FHVGDKSVTRPLESVETLVSLCYRGVDGFLSVEEEERVDRIAPVVSFAQPARESIVMVTVNHDNFALPNLGLRGAFGQPGGGMGALGLDALFIFDVALEPPVGVPRFMVVASPKVEDVMEELKARAQQGGYSPRRLPAGV